ncbi:hypothetical protein [Sulfuriflexus mobilis]|uniref:hypothetical protein n=1 Tax=Sulfuriflexus mobilis TaxID=1811807 RepID=UPI000F838ADB|nr:hypothetical protein [Sulfuriflexus mobilis]
MAGIESLVEQHIKENEARLKHVDEVLAQAHKEAGETAKTSEIEDDLAVLRGERDRLASHFDELKMRSLQDWQQESIEKAGPMAVWDSLAQQLEKLLERITR